MDMLFQYLIMSAFVFIGIMFVLAITSLSMKNSQLQETLREVSIVSIGLGLLLGGIGLLGSMFAEGNALPPLNFGLGLYAVIYGIKLLRDVYLSEKGQLTQLYHTVRTALKDTEVPKSGDDPENN